ncbi:MAG: Ig-like domain-containing protein, partial [Pseudohongiella sp.]|nr:Ig-like domain-containing protein [Pseudohongiella sp.]
SSLSVEGDGSKTVQVRQMDVAGNVSTAGSLSFTLDTTAPEGPGLSLALDTSNGSDNITSSATINISGLESDATWQYSLDGSTWSDGSGSTINVQEEGTYTLQVRQTDVAGNVSVIESLNFTLDTSAATPSLRLTNDSGASSSDLITNDGRVTVEGLESNASWQFSVDGGSNWTDGSGNSIEVTTEDSYDIRVRQTDVAGNQSSVGSLTFTLDKTVQAPVIMLVKDNGSSSSDLITNDGRVSVSGLESGASWEYRIGDDSDAQWVAGSSGEFSVNGASNSGSDGDKTVYVRQTDAAGNLSDTSSFTFELDTIAPAGGSISILTDTNIDLDGVTSNGRVRLPSDSSGTRQYSLDGGETWVTVAPRVRDFRVTSEGDVNALFRYIDTAGNASEVSSLSFVLDETAPSQAPAMSLASDTGNTSDQITSTGTINVTGLDADTTWQYQVNSGDWTAGSGSSFSVEGDGNNTLWVRQMDLAGNVSPSASLNFTLDTEAITPTLSLNVDSNLASDNISSSATINISGLESDATWQYSFDGSTWSQGSGSSLSVQEDGSYDLHVRQIDVAGNVSESGLIGFTLDTKAPAEPVLSLADDTNAGADRITSNGTVNIDGLELDAVWQYRLDGSTWVDGSGSSVSVETDGSKTIEVRQMDVAGNTSATASLLFTLDATAPLSVELTLESPVQLGS